MAGLTIGVLAKTTGCNVETIRYYERIGLMPAPARTTGGHRFYATPAAKRLAFIRRARELGFTLDDVRALLSLIDGHDLTCAEVRNLTLDHLDRVRAKIRDLRTIARVLGDMAAQCDGDARPDCPIIAALYPTSA